jgi:hypothetical protein
MMENMAVSETRGTPIAMTSARVRRHARRANWTMKATRPLKTDDTDDIANQNVTAAMQTEDAAQYSARFQSPVKA